MNTSNPPSSSKLSTSCGCSGGYGEPDETSVARRDFLKAAGAVAGAAYLGGGSLVWAEPGQSFEDLIPSDKKLDPAWIRSLFERGEPEVYSDWDKQLKYIGMPIGGIGCGQLYLGGDGRLWLWDIFKCNYRREPDHSQHLKAMTLCGHYTDPVAFGEQYNKFNGASVQQGFSVRVRTNGDSVIKTLDHHGFPAVTFRGEYPIGKVTYADAALPVKIELEAFSPFIPLNAADSALPATVMSFTLTNTGDKPAEVDLGGWLENTTCPYIKDAGSNRRLNRLVRDAGRITVLSTIGPQTSREDIVLADFEGDDWGPWRAQGEAFGGGPFPVRSLADYQHITGHHGRALVNSHNTRGGTGHDDADRRVGTLTSPKFVIQRKFITMSVGGGKHAANAYIEVLVDGERIAKVTGHNSNALRPVSIDVSTHEQREAQIRIVDNARGGWGNIQADRIVLTDQPAAIDSLEARHGYGSMALSLLHDDVAAWGAAALTQPQELFEHVGAVSTDDGQAKPLDQTLLGALGATVSLAPGESRTLDFAITWYFPDYNETDAAPGFLSRLRDFKNLRRHYAPRFGSAGEVAGYLAQNKARLLGDTRKWNRTWYDSTLPHWFLDRSFIAIDCAATNVLHWFDSGRLYGWEGVDCCPGTCTHVWHYAQALGRIFPELERTFREITDYDIAFHQDTGLIGSRAESADHEATDGQAGTILRVYREHLMSADDAFLKRLWPKIKKSIEFLMAKDRDKDGLLEGRQPHTLDAAWFGPMGWISGLYLAVLAAGAAMADEVQDKAFALRCRRILHQGRRNIVKKLFNGEYFIHKPDPKHPRALRTGPGCHIDQVLGQGWAHQVGLDRVIPKKQTISALKSLWKYNFAPDAGAYAVKHVEIEQTVRWYAMPGETGLVMCTWPKGGAKEAIPGDKLRPTKNPDVWTGPGGYFNECMNGFEYQVAGHMIAEGEPGDELVEHGLAVVKAVHERYSAHKRNPYNEIECSDHYARSMASFGVFLSACGYEYHGPKGHLGFAPRLTPENFKAPFTAAEGWGTFSQRIDQRAMEASIEVKMGRLSLKTLALSSKQKVAGAMVNGQARPFDQQDQRVVIELDKPMIVHVDETVEIKLILNAPNRTIGRDSIRPKASDLDK